MSCHISFFLSPFICWYCILSLFSVYRYLHVFPCSTSCITLFMSSFKFSKWTNFPSFIQSLHTCQVQIPYGYHHWRCNYLHLFLEFFLSFTYNLQIIQLKQAWYLCLCCVFFNTVFNLFRCSVMRIRLMQNSSCDNGSPGNIPCCVSVSSVSISFPSVCRRMVSLSKRYYFIIKSN